MYIEFDESEYLDSAVSDEALRLVASFCGREVADKLLYKDKKLCTIYTNFSKRTGANR
jgi:hypothetical protein